MPGRAAPAGRVQQLKALGWNLGGSRQSSDGVTVVLYEVPFQAAHPDALELHLHGPSECRAIAAFLEDEIAVRVLPSTSAPVGPLRGVTAILVRPVAPLQGEERDEWVIFRRGSSVIPYIIAIGTERTFKIKRREARLINVDSNGQRISRSS